MSITLSAVVEDGTAVAIVAAMRDEREQRATESALAAEQARLVAATAELRTNASFLERIGDVAGVGGWEYDVITQTLTWSAQTRRLHEVPDDYVADLASAVEFYAPEARPLISDAVGAAMVDGTPWDLELELITATGRRIWARAQGLAECVDGRTVRLVGAFQDITAHVELREALASSIEQLRVTLESIGDAVVTTDAAGIVTWMNPVAERLLDRTRGTSVWQPFAEVVPLVDERDGQVLPNPVDPDSTPWPADAEPALVKPSGAHVGVEHTTTPIRGADGTRTGAVTVLRDVAAQRSARREVDYHATHDPLTGLANRRDFEHRLEDAIGRAAKGESGVLLAIDLDRFKAVNDTGGHAAGDAVLCRVAALLQEEVRSDDVVARVGGDEFAIILERCSLQRGHHIATKLAAKIARTAFRFEGGFHHIGASVGVAVIDRNAGDISAVCRVADAACYEQKSAHRPGRDGARTVAADLITP